MTKKINQLQRKIMRRIYYAFAKRIATHQITMQLGLFVVALFVFARLVHVRSVIDNFLSTDVGHIPSFILGALMHGEVLTLIAVGVLMFTALSVPLQIKAQFIPKFHTHERQVV